MHDVVIVGSGPTGMMLAAELRLAGVDVVVLERRATQALAGRRGGGIPRPHDRAARPARDRRPVPRRGHDAWTGSHSRGTMLDLSDLPTRHPYTLALFQNHIERLLLGWVEELGAPIRRGTEVTGVAPDDDGVDVRLASGESVRTRYVVGADGGRSVVRRAAGIEFVGPDATRSSLIAEVEATEELPAGREGRRAGRSRACTAMGGRHGAGRADRGRAGSGHRAHAGGPAARVGRGVRHRLRRAQPDLAVAVHRRHPAGSVLSRGPGAAGRRRRARPLAHGRTGHRPRACRTPSTSAGSSARSCAAPPTTTCSTPTTPSGTRPAPASLEVHDGAVAVPAGRPPAGGVARPARRDSAGRRRSHPDRGADHRA